MSTQFEDLLNYAKSQQEPQRLLLLFAAVEQTNKSNKNPRGSITPTMCVDKLPQEIDSFKQLCDEADSVSKKWQFILVASLAGENGKAPSAEQAEPFLNKMTNDLASGQNMHQYVVFDRQQNPIELHAG